MLSWLFVSSLLGEVLYTSFWTSTVEDYPEPRYIWVFPRNPLKYLQLLAGIH